jgi:hypothetical protein
MFSKINAFFKKYPWVPNFVISLLGVLFSLMLFWVNSNISGISKELLDSIREIRTNTSLLAENLKDRTNGGLTVVVGVNPKEIKENLAFVYENNELNLRPGDVILLKNYTDNTFQPSMKFIIQKSLPQTDNKSRASIFISEVAAKRLGFENYRSQGTIELKMLRIPSR